MAPGFIYLAETPDRRTVKIGFSIDPERRIREITTFGPLRLLAEIEGTIHEEKALHRALADFAVYEFYPRSVLSHYAVPEAFRRFRIPGPANDEPAPMTAEQGQRIVALLDALAAEVEELARREVVSEGLAKEARACLRLVKGGET